MHGQRAGVALGSPGVALPAAASVTEVSSVADAVMVAASLLPVMVT